jgi:hypothetical protein
MLHNDPIYSASYRFLYENPSYYDRDYMRKLYDLFLEDLFKES